MLLRFLYRGLRARVRDHRAELSALLGAIRPGETAVDAGAHKGAFLPSLARAARPGRVVAFEPQPAVADYLRRACRASRLDNILVEMAGLSDMTGTRTMHVPARGEGNPGASFEEAIQTISVCRDLDVPVVTMDEYFRGETVRIAAVKVDVEGHELSVFRGAEEVLRRHGPLLVFESEERHLHPGGVRRVIGFLQERGYDGFFIERSRLRPIREFDPALHQRQEGERFWDAPDYCNNFIMSKA
jgi:FkbM family methyltransferase